APLTIEPVGRLPDQSAMSAETARLRERLAGIQAPTDQDLSVWLSGRVFERLISDVGKLPDPNRTATLSTLRFKGKLKEAGGGSSFASAYAELTGDNPVRGRAVVSDVLGQWAGEKGLKVAAKVTGDVTVTAHVHANLIAGGGVGERIVALGGGGTQIEGWLAPRIVNVDGHSVLLIEPDFDCERFSFGLVIAGSSPTPVSLTGLNVTIYGSVGGQVVPKQVLVSDVPHWVSGRGADGASLLLGNDDKQLVLEPRWRAASVVTTPVLAAAASEGLRVGFKLNITYSDVAPPGEVRSETEKVIKDKIAKEIGSKSCGEPVIDFGLGGLNISNLASGLLLPPGVSSVLGPLGVPPPTVPQLIQNSPVVKFFKRLF
ncbi:Hypothetical protein, partial CDS, partial [Neorhizobium galegae bv. officinalis]